MTKKSAISVQFNEKDAEFITFNSLITQNIPE